MGASVGEREPHLPSCTYLTKKIGELRTGKNDYVKG